MIQVENVAKRYGVHMAVDDLSFTVEKGQIYGFLGPNGAGKSTTMNIMTGYIAASSGTVRINGHDILKEPESAKKCIGYLPEVPPLYLDMTVWEYLMFVAELKKVPGKQRIDHVEEIVEKLQLSNVEDRLIKNISKGYKQRVGLAQALIGYPDVLILDEPTVGLDVMVRDELLDMLRNYMEEDENRSILISSHISSDLETLCDDFYMIHEGKILLHEETDVLLDNYAVLKLEQNQFEKLDKQYLLKCKKESYGYCCLTNERQFYIENYPDII